MSNWAPTLPNNGTPKYIALADSIENDIKSGVLVAGDRLPPQRVLSEALGIDFTTVSRGYAEAKKRRLIDSQVGKGTFVKDTGSNDNTTPDPRRADQIDLRYNLPPEPTDPELIARMQNGMNAVSSNIVNLLRYQSARTSELDNTAASAWLSKKGLVPNQNRVLISPGAHPAITAALRLLTNTGETILSENITYPGIRSIAHMLGLKLVGLETDGEGILPDELETAIQTHSPKALYLNPTLQNPTTLTMSERRREEIADVLQKHGLPLIEDDAYGFVSYERPTPIALLIPQLTWYISGLSKCLGAGLRLAYVVAPNTRAAFQFSSALDVMTVMPSPLTMALASQWIMDGTADQICSFLKKETKARQDLARNILEDFKYKADPYSFNVWLEVPDLPLRITSLSRFAPAGMGISTSDIFTVNGQASNYVRLCLGGKMSRDDLANNLHTFAHTMSGQSVFG